MHFWTGSRTATEPALWLIKRLLRPKSNQLFQTATTDRIGDTEKKRETSLERPRKKEIKKENYDLSSSFRLLFSSKSFWCPRFKGTCLSVAPRGGKSVTAWQVWNKRQGWLEEKKIETNSLRFSLLYYAQENVVPRWTYFDFEAGQNERIPLYISLRSIYLIVALLSSWPTDDLLMRWSTSRRFEEIPLSTCTQR